MQPPLEPRFILPRFVRLIIRRFALVVCPPDLYTQRLLPPLLAAVEQYCGALPPPLRLGVFAAFLVFDQGARLYPPARGRRFVALDPARADAYFRTWVHSPNPTRRYVATLLKGLVTLPYYELPAVQAQIGYAPAPYIAEVARRRLARYGAAIRQGEAAIFAAAPPSTGEGVE